MAQDLLMSVMPKENMTKIPMGPEDNQSRIPTSNIAPSPVANSSRVTSSRSVVSSGSGKSSSSQADTAKEIAEKQAEEERKAARRAYESKVKIAKGAKESAKGQYGWLIDTLGSNKQDLLDQVAMNESQGLQNYDKQKADTGKSYDEAKQTILSTYRDLGANQEKIMRGAGMTSSSRSTEAALRLNSLLGKDMSNISTKEADSLALIGQAIQDFQTKIASTRDSIEREAKTKADKAALDYNDQIKAIDNNLMLSDNERADAYAAAELRLSQATAAVDQWANSLKTTAAQSASVMKGSLDDFISNVTNQNGLLNASLAEKKSALDALLSGAGSTSLSQNDTSIMTPMTGVYKKANKTYKSVEDLQAAIDSGEVTDPGDVASQMAQLQGGGASVIPQDTLLQSVLR